MNKSIHRDMKICGCCPKLNIGKGLNKFVYNCPIADGGWRTKEMQEEWYIPDGCIMMMEYIILNSEDKKTT